MPTNTIKPEVSVVMATYNEPWDIICKSIRSILDQTFSNLELIIIDDSTIDETKRAIDSFSVDSRVIIIRESERIGFVKSLNKGFLQARGKYIARMDGDDISIQNRIELQVSYLNMHPSVSVVGGSMNIIDETDKVISYRKYPTSDLILRCLSVYRTPLAHPTVMIRQSCIRDGFLYDEAFEKSEDLEYWLRLRKNGYKFANMANFLLNYRVWGDLSKKRVRIHWSYNFQARIKNFSVRDPLFSILSVLVSSIYTIMPNFIIKAIYDKENKKIIKNNMIANN